MSILLDGRLFTKRISAIVDAWKSYECDVIVICTGTSQDDQYQKSTALQIFEFPETLIAIFKDKTVFYTSAKKASILQTLGSDSIEILSRTKDANENAESWNRLVQMFGASIGIIEKDSFDGKFIDEYKKFVSIPTKDVSLQLSLILAVKDDIELKIIKIASRITSQVMKNYFISEIESILDDDKKITHRKFTELIEGVLDESFRKRLKLPSDISFDMSDWCYSPIIQSGGKYDLKPSVESDGYKSCSNYSDQLHAGVVVCSIGVKYKSYCSNISRTFLIDPEKQKEKNYKFLLELQELAINHIKDGVACKDVYGKCVDLIEKKRPELKSKFTKNIGFGMGLEFRESSFVLGELKSGMVLNLSIGFSDLENPDGADSNSKNYALLVSDTVQVVGDKCLLFTEVNKDPTDVSYIFKETDPDAATNGVEEGETSAPVTRPKKTVILPSKRGNADESMSNEQKRREHQRELAEQKHQEGLERFGKDPENDDDKSSQKLMFKKFVSYKKDTQIPNETKEIRVLVDRRNQSIILPIYGLAVPFHITTIKNVSKSEDLSQVFLRFNFQTPGQSLGKKDPTSIPYDDPEATFIRSITFKSTDVYRFNEIFREINELKKEITKVESERKEMSDLVTQDKLVELRGKRPARLGDVFVRPALEGKKFPGEIEIHVNGLRYMSQVRNDQKVDILFSNIKHLFFQPCNHELVVLIHIHLKDPIMIGKKKTSDVQFYREVVDANFDETGNKRRRHNYGDEDELMAEQEERKLRSQLNREFKDFASKVTETSKNQVSVDVPYRDLGFLGVPHRQLVLMQPSTDCLVHLTDPPFFVITLVDIEIAHLERVQFGLKNFDIAIVYKDFNKPITHINSIPMDQLDNVKEWLDSVDVAFNEGPVNLSWPQIMKTINEDPAAFFAEGGWGFLNMDAEEEEESESASEFAGSEAALSGSSASASESGSGSGFSEGGSGSDSGDETGEDWDELEKKAASKDERKRAVQGSDSDDDGDRRRKR